MELRQLVYFDAIIRHGGFTRAAEQLHVAQPAVSAQIRRLETELGVTLLERTTRRVRLTQAGELLLGRARRALGELDGARADLAELADVLRGRVRIGALQATGPFDLPAALAGFHARYPGVELSLRSGRLRELLAALDADEIDLAIGPLRDEVPDRFTAHALFTEELVLLTALGHPLAHQGALPLGAVRDDPFICLPAESGLRAILDRSAAEAGFVAHVPFEDVNLTRIRDLVAHGLGVALLARSVADAPGPPVVTHPLLPTGLRRRVGLLHHRHRPLPAAARACRTFLINRPVPPPSATSRPTVPAPSATEHAAGGASPSPEPFCSA